MSPITAAGTSDLFKMSNSLMLSSSSFTVHGTYKAIGPVNSATVPFSVEFRWPQPFTSSFAFFQTGIRGGAGFGDGFEFDSV